MSQTESPTVSVSTAEKSPILRTLEVEVEAGRVRKAFDRAYRDLARRVRVRGFRPGKTPRAVLERLYGATMAEEIERLLVSETLSEAVDRSGLEPVSEPAVDADVPQPDAAFHYRVDIEVRPPIELPELEGLPARRPLVFVGDEDVEREIQTLRERRAPLADAPEEEASEGSVLGIDYEGRIAGEPFEGGSAEGAKVVLGSGRSVPGFEEQLEGVRVGDAREVRITFPEDYPAEDVAGKEAVFTVRVRAHQRRQVPELDDAFVQGLGEELENVEALRERVRQDLEAARERAAKEEMRRSVLDALIERTSFDVPPGMVERRLSQRLSMAHQQLESAIPHEELHARLDQWREDWRPSAEREVRETLLLGEVANARDFEAEEAEVDERLERMAREQGVAPDRLRQAYEERGLLGGLRAAIREEKALEFLLATAKVEEITGT